MMFRKMDRIVKSTTATLNVRSQMNLHPAQNGGVRTAVATLTAVLALTTATSAFAEDTAFSLGLDPALGLDPSAPQVGALPGGMTPAFGAKAADETDWRFDFHGFIRAPLRLAINKREDPKEGQAEVVYHAPPQVPDDLEMFSHTGVVPTPYAQLNFSYGNSVVTGTATIVAQQPTVATGFFNPSTQLGVNDLFMTVVPDWGKALLVKFNLGAFSNRYGNMGENDEGQYGTPMIARINGVGETITASFGVGDWAFSVEQGIQGQSNKPNIDITPDVWNDYADPNVGSGFANHVHAAVNYKGMASLTGHYITAFTQDARATGANGRDGIISVLGADLRLGMGRFGHLFGGFAATKAEDANSVGRIIEVLNTRGGPGLREHYLGDDEDGYVNGSLTTFAAQYDVSIGKIIAHPRPFEGNGPDIVVSLFGLQTSVDSEDAKFDGITKRKFGAEAAYGWLSWLGYSLRYDRVDPDVDNDRKSFAVISPRLIFRTDWNSRDQVVLQYSRWLNGSQVFIRTGSPPLEDPTAIPDEHMISLSGSMWW